MVTILNVLFGILAGGVAYWLCTKNRMDTGLAALVAVIVGIIVFLLNIARSIPQ